MRIQRSLFSLFAFFCLSTLRVFGQLPGAPINGGSQSVGVQKSGEESKAASLGSQSASSIGQTADSAEGTLANDFSPKLSEDTRYRMFFRFMGTLDELASRMEKEGNSKAAEAWKTHLARGAGLNANEGTLLRSIALDCNRALAAKDGELQTQVATIRTQRPNAASAQIFKSPEVIQIDTERQEVLQSYLNQLKLQLGEPSFDKLDGYVKELFKHSVTVSSPAVDSSNASGSQITKAPRGLSQPGANQ